MGVVFSKTSTSAHKDQIVIYSPLPYTVDVEDDIKIVIVSVSAYDNDPWDYPHLVTTSDIIDVNEDDYYSITSDNFYPRTNTNQSYTHDGRLDSKDEMDGMVEYYIRVVEI